MNILFLEPFNGGAHREFLIGLCAHSRHEIHVESLPARLWKWRLRVAGLTLAQRVMDPEKYDLVVATGLLDLAQVRAVWGGKTPPLLLYLHESQVSYPVPSGKSTTAELLWRDITNIAVADCVVFNSEFHRAAFRKRLPEVMEQLPDAEARPQFSLGLFDRRSRVLYPGCRFEECNARGTLNGPPVVIWNHRWEFDKDPATFVGVLKDVASRDVSFAVALLGERLVPEPDALRQARNTLGGRIIYDQFPPRSVYLSQLVRGNVVVSTALQENFGIAIMEAMHAGCMPLLPDRLVYPELIPRELHGRCLYSDRDDLIERLVRELQTQMTERDRWRKIAIPHAWPRVIHTYDELFETVAQA